MGAEQSALLTPEQLKKYHEDGYLVVHNLLTEGEVDAFVNYEATQYPEWRNSLHNHKKDQQWASIAKHPRIVGIIKQILQSEKPNIIKTFGKYDKRESDDNARI
jgi:hypothetical protein